MSTYVDTRADIDRDDLPLPAYGLVDAVLGFVVFYVFVDRATSPIVDVVTTALSGVAPSLVRFGLAAALWFVLVVTVLDQVRRQVVAFREPTVEVPDVPQLLGYLVLVLAGGAVAVWAFDRAIEAGIALIRVIATLEIGAFASVEFVVMIVFFVTFAVASWALDRLVIGGFRALITA